MITSQSLIITDHLHLFALKKIPVLDLTLFHTTLTKPFKNPNLHNIFILVSFIVKNMMKDQYHAYNNINYPSYHFTGFLNSHCCPCLKTDSWYGGGSKCPLFYEIVLILWVQMILSLSISCNWISKRSGIVLVFLIYWLVPMLLVPLILINVRF